MAVCTPLKLLCTVSSCIVFACVGLLFTSPHTSFSSSFPSLKGIFFIARQNVQFHLGHHSPRPSSSFRGTLDQLLDGPATANGGAGPWNTAFLHTSGMACASEGRRADPISRRRLSTRKSRKSKAAKPKVVVRASARRRDCSTESKACKVFYNATCCAGTCVNVQLDNNNCGACGRRCAFTEACCEGACKDLNTDEFNCGRCGNVCPDDSCQYGLCGYY
ncbi:hypothetical protein KP509_02G036000 [Ceratopteris richardii]|uniref:Uncharacterized protein n=1 Tax=Ceratopteris richardii TaxID=49495 RepID=A0A8T2VCW3_CERRI|nr:hypothetical protein KP509_02G036000 [Ceratopteris richardii]